MTNDSSTGGYILPSSSPQPDDVSLDIILQNLIVGITGIAGAMVRPRWQLVPPIEPDITQDWCAVGVTDELPDDGLPSETFDGTKLTTIEYLVVTVIASFYGPNARLNAENFRKGIMVAQNREALYFQNISLVERPGGIVFAPTFIATRARPRADVSFRLRRSIITDWPINSIEVAVVHATIEKPQGTIEETIITPNSLSPLME